MPRKRTPKPKSEKSPVKLIDVTSARQLPERYFVLPENWQELLESKRSKLLARGLKVVEPLKVYRWRRTVVKEVVDICVELEALPQ